MKVTLIDYTGKGQPRPEKYAAAVLVFAKNTRLTMTPSLFDDILNWPDENLFEELKYISNTIPASHEFCDFTFMVEGVTRAFTHQFVRSRQFSFAQQTMRVLDVSEGNGWEYATGPTIENDPARKTSYDTAMQMIAEEYEGQIRAGATVEDARGVLPTNILTNIMAKCNLRTFVELVRKRSGPRIQGEYRSVLNAMQDAVINVYPWITLFTSRTTDNAARELDRLIAGLKLDPVAINHMHKLVDQCRSQS